MGNINAELALIYISALSLAWILPPCQHLVPHSIEFRAIWYPLAQFKNNRQRWQSLAVFSIVQRHSLPFWYRLVPFHTVPHHLDPYHTVWKPLDTIVLVMMEMVTHKYLQYKEEYCSVSRCLIFGINSRYWRHLWCLWLQTTRCCELKLGTAQPQLVSLHLSEGI